MQLGGSLENRSLTLRLGLAPLLAFSLVVSGVTMPSRGQDTLLGEPASGSIAAAAPVSSKELQKKTSQLKELESRISATRSKIAGADTRRKRVLENLSAIERSLDESELRLSKVKARIAVTDQQIREAERNLSSAERRLAVLRKQLAERQARLNGRLREVYKTGGMNYLELLFSATNFSDFFMRYDLLKRFIQRDVDLYQEVKQQKSELEAAKKEIEEVRAGLLSKKQSIVALRTDEEREIKKLKTSAGERAALVRKIEREKEMYEAALREEEEDHKELLKFIRDAQKRAAEQRKGSPEPELAGGRFLWPLPVRGRITSGYGWRTHPIFKTRSFHTGIDIAVPTGTSVRSAQQGTVIFSGSAGGYGKTVILDHGGGITTLYAHNSVLVAGVGEKVARGKEIAKAGSTGFSTGPHLHFEVLKDGNHTDPNPWLR